MAHAITHSHDFTPEEALHEIKAERTRRSWVAGVLFLLAGIGIVTAGYLSYRDLPAPASPANNAPARVEP